MTQKDIFFKQKKLFNPEEKQPLIVVYGAGSIGSHLVVGLAKSGFKNLLVVDYDIVEPDNLPAQSYPYSVVMSNKGLFKVDALKDFVKGFTGLEIETENTKITSEYLLTPEMDSIHICCFDNIEGRKTLFNKLKNYPVHYLDGRIGGFNIEKYYCDMLNQEQQQKYEETLQGNFSELECGEKTLWGVNTLLSSKLLSDVIKITKKDKPKMMMKANFNSDLIISKED